MDLGRLGLWFLVLSVVAVLAGCATVRPAASAPWHCLAERGSERVVLFVHGFGGDPEGTWRNAATGAYWPDLLAADPKMATFDVCVVSYASPLLGRASTIEEIAQRLLQQFRDRGFFTRYRQIHFITHSMGGLIIKRLLTVLNRPPELEKLRLVRTVLFISTPAQGATLAEVTSWLSLNPQMRDMAPADLNSFLQSLENQWDILLQDRDSAGGVFPRVYCAYETLPTAGVMVVSRMYAATRCDPTRYPIDLDHRAIVKPGSRDDEPYPWALARILETAAMPPSPVAPGYQAKAPEVTVFIDCRSVLLPVPVSPPTRVFVLDTFPAILSGLAEYVFGADSPATRWPTSNAQGWAYHCEVRNYGDVPLFNVQMSFKLTFKEVIEERPQSGTKKGTSGRVVLIRERPIEIPVLEAPKGGFDFYIWNQVVQFVDVSLPEYATLEVSGERDRRQVRVMRSPNAAFTLGPARSPGL